MREDIDRRKFFTRSAAALALKKTADAAQGRTAAKKVKYGIVGAGNRGRNTHVRIATHYLPEVEVAAICDITKENLDQALSAAPGAKGYDDYHKMIESESQLDAVIVAVPNFLHAEVTMAALKAGKHVLVEKPMAIHLADADRMMQEAHNNHRVLQVGLQARYGTVYEQMVKLIKDGAIGEIELVQANLFRGDWNPRSWRYRDPATGKETNWRFLTKCAGSSLLEDGIHELDSILWLVGSTPTLVEARGGNNVFKDRETIDNALLTIEFASGARCSFSYTVFTPGVSDLRAFRFFGSKGEMSLGIGLAEEMRGTGKSTVAVERYRGRPERIPVPRLTSEEEASWKEEAGAVSTDVESLREHKKFLASILDNAPVFADGQVGKNAIHVSLAAERSLRTGQTLVWSNESII
jgi:predicted dehydrogenase